MFSQHYKLNIRTCDGCACRCALGYEEHDYGLFYPTVNMQRLTTWIDADGKYQTPFAKNAADALSRARRAVKTGDHYKTGFVPVYGSVKCALCDLPDSKKCVLNWVRTNDNSFYASIGGEYCRFGAVPVDVMKIDSKNVTAETLGDALNKLRMYIAKNCDKVKSR